MYTCTHPHTSVRLLLYFCTTFHVSGIVISALSVVTLMSSALSPTA